MLSSSSSLRCEIIEDASRLEALWRGLEEHGIFTPYQRYDWVMAFIRHMKQESLLKRSHYHMVALRGDNDRLVGLLPLHVEKRHGLIIASMIGGKHANFCCPVLAKDHSQENITQALIEIGQSQLKIDAYKWYNLPAEWRGTVNPLLIGKVHKSPSDAAFLTLQPDSTALIETVISADTRKKLRKKEKKLTALGTIQHVIAKDKAAAEAVLATFYTQKALRFRTLGIPNPFEEASIQGFIHEASTTRLLEGTPAIELHALTVNEKIIAIYGGAVDHTRFSGMFNSFDAADEEISKCSPGDLLLLKIIQDQCARGRQILDLGVGEARYKSSFCNEICLLYNAFLPVTRLGRFYVGTIERYSGMKRRIKQTPWIWNSVRKAQAFWHKG
jgi:CelD/BcsL family acetyltransferase involved in cellulose biosynthesis